MPAEMSPRKPSLLYRILRELLKKAVNLTENLRITEKRGLDLRK
jgi:hypothetical protein